MRDKVNSPYDTKFAVRLVWHGSEVVKFSDEVYRFWKPCSRCGVNLFTHIS